MKYIFILSCAAIVLISCNSTKSSTSQEEIAVVEEKVIIDNEVIVEPTPKPMKMMLVGKEDRKALQIAPFNVWYTPNYENYTVDGESLAAIQKGLDGVSITTFMGTWCGDSKRQTPRMFKILDQVNFEDQNLELITVDRTKQNPKEYTDGKNIMRVPTFIFVKEGKEIGRIVERPVETLEKDMLKILTSEPYKHAYEN